MGITIKASGQCWQRLGGNLVAEQSSIADAVRLDRWLWAARFYKSRALAAETCDGGKVEVNGFTAKPHKLVPVHDMVSFTHPSGPKELRGSPEISRQGPASPLFTLRQGQGERVGCGNR